MMTALALMVLLSSDSVGWEVSGDMYCDSDPDTGECSDGTPNPPMPECPIQPCVELILNEEGTLVPESV